MTEKRFRVNELVKYNYSEIGEYIDENHTDRPLRNDEICNLLNDLSKREEQLLFEIDDFQDLLSKNDNVCHDRIINLIDKKIAVLTDAKIKSFQNGDEELLMKIKFSIQVLRELKEVINDLSS